MQIEPRVTLNVEPCDPEDAVPSDDAARESAREAVRDALAHAQGWGFRHDLADVLSTQVISVEAAE
jgi:hypothetical protein